MLLTIDLMIVDLLTKGYRPKYLLVM